LPELPEVETVRLGLQPVLEGYRFTHVEVRRADLRSPFPKEFARRLTGRRVLCLRRRAKYILADLDNGETLVIHLGMSGRMSVYAHSKHRELGQFYYEIAPADAGHGKHDHVVFETDAPAQIVFTDHRRFGLMTLLDSEALDAHPLFKGLGGEPLSEQFNSGYLKRVLKGRKTPIKFALLDQRVIAGLGNIYVCESLWRSHISPRKHAGRIKLAQIELLGPAIQSVLREAIQAGGSSLRDHKRVDGELGYFQKTFAVYDREGKPCKTPNCTGIIRRIVQAGRSTFYCPACQK
jgi:formamidopyrimidine-DNA glycosylase